MKVFFLFILYSLVIGAQTETPDRSESASSLARRCHQPGNSCGECETHLQNDLNAILSRVTGTRMDNLSHWGDTREAVPNPSNIPLQNTNLNDVLSQIIGVFKRNNTSGDQRLNFVVIGESESLQQTTVRDGKMYPRIMLKSPNSELMVTFNTDPNSRGYNTLEIMRWNGRKGRYEFQELNFGNRNERPHLDVSGTKCLECHKSPSPRPNWDTYRAWAGIVPSRDDMLEAQVQDGQLSATTGLQPDARAYLGLLDRIAADKDSGAHSRLSLLDIPFDDKVQLKDYVAATRPGTNKEKVDLIRRRINETGFYRIKHFPDTEDARSNPNLTFNMDEKTAPYAGPSQVAFDQMIGQNMCKVATDLKNNANYDKFKYALALILKCNKVPDETTYPAAFVNRIREFYQRSQYSTIADLPATDRPAPDRSLPFTELHTLVERDTLANQNHANDFKYNRHERFLNSYLTGVEREPATQASTEARFYSEQVITPTQSLFHAIGDPGGVNGVAESAGSQIANIRMLLEPFNVDVSHWSMVPGKNTGYNSFSFSDQFELLSEQPLFNDIFREAGQSCDALETKAKEALDVAPTVAANVAPSAQIDQASLCARVNDNSGVAQDFLPILRETVKAPMVQMLRKCAGCHGQGAEMEFDGLSDFIANPSNDTKFVDFLNGPDVLYGKKIIDVLQYKLGVHQPNTYGEDMPPSDFRDNAEYAEQNHLDPITVQNTRRRQLAFYLTLFAAKKDPSVLRRRCDSISGDHSREHITPSPLPPAAPATRH